MIESPTFSRSAALSILTHAPADKVNELAETLLPHLGEITVLQNRTGLVMMPYRDSSQGALFHLGEALVAEAHIRLGNSGVEGYGMVLGRDLVFAMGVAVLDAAFASAIMTDSILTFLTEQQQIQAATDENLLRKVESTRVEMETF